MISRNEDQYLSGLRLLFGIDSRNEDQLLSGLRLLLHEVVLERIIVETKTNF